MQSNLATSLAHLSALYDRNYLDCRRRQAVVMLSLRGMPVDWLLCDALTSVGQIFEQTVLNQIPKSWFKSEVMSPGNSEILGVSQQTLTPVNFGDLVEQGLDLLGRHGFFLFDGDVYHLPHRTDYYQKNHTSHTVVVDGISADEFSIIDDSVELVLNSYRYPGALIDNFYTHNPDREVTVFLSRTMTIDETRNAAADRASTAIERYLQDEDLRLLEDIKAIADYSYESVQIRTRKLHDAFAVLSGSRRLFSRYLLAAYGKQPASNLLAASVECATSVKNYFMKAGMKGELKPELVVPLCDELIAIECGLKDCLRVHATAPAV